MNFPSGTASWLVLVTGPDARRRADVLASAAPSPPTLAEDRDPIDRGPAVSIRATGARPRSTGWAWSHGPLAGIASDALRTDADAATVVVAGDGTVIVRSGVSGAQPLYVHHRSGPEAEVTSHLHLLTPAVDGALTPDADGWSEIIATGGPLGGRTPAEQLRRLRPDEALQADRDRVHLTRAHWEWLEHTERTGGRVEAVADALDAALRPLADVGPLHVPLSAGWDSRTLAAAAGSHSTDVATWTTSKDLGTAREELVARQVARTLHLPHTLVHGHAQHFTDDLDRYGQLVSHQTPYHVWLLPLAERIGVQPGTVLDGLGGGVFFGGAFPPGRTPRSGHARAEDGLRYLRSSTRVLHPGVEAEIEERARHGLRTATAAVSGHREAEALSAYVTRTLPGISLGPYGLLAAHTRVSTPFLTHPAVLASTAIEPRARAGRRLYPQLLQRWSPAVAALQVVREPPPGQRHRPIRSASATTAAAIRDGLLAHPVHRLLHPELRSADVAGWRRRLRSHADQHVLRGLWLLARWSDAHDAADRLPFSSQGR